MSLAVSAHIHVLHFSCSNCISGHHLSTKLCCSDQWSYRYRATDIMISIILWSSSRERESSRAVLATRL